MFRAAQSARYALMKEADPQALRADLATYFGPRAASYLAAYEKVRKQVVEKRRWVQLWSWPAFLLGFVWMFYRKIYIWGALLFLLPIVAAVVFGTSGMAGLAGVLGVLGKRMYVEAGLSRISKANALGLTGQERTDYLSRAGGVSWIGGGLALFILIGMIAISVAASLKRPH
ncbi:MAG: hypothetical protein ACM30I_09010 [Gemmatimonas sp.]